MALIKGKQIAANSIALNRLPKQDSGKILVGQGALADIDFKTLSGDATLADTGALSIAANAIIESKIANDAISTAKIQNDAIDNSKIADNAVQELQIADNAVTENKIANLSVSANKLQDLSVSTGKLINNSVNFAKLNADVWSDAVDLSNNDKLPTSLAVKTYITNNTTALANTDALAEGNTNLYFTNARAQAAAVVDSTAGSETTQAPSVSAIKSYVDGKFETAVQGLDFRAACKTASTDNVNLATPGASINGFTFTAGGERVLLKNQDDAKQNGIYNWNGVAVPLTRSPDSDDDPDGEVTGGMLTFIEAGNLAGTSWVLNSPAGGVVFGTDNLEFVQFSSGAAYQAGSGIAISGLSISLNLSNLADVDALAKEDKLSLTDASDSSVGKLVSVADLATFLADGSTVTATNGKLTSTATGGTLKRDISTNPTAVAASATGSTGLTISSTPSSDGHVQVFINGLSYNIGSATNSEVFFSNDNGTTAKTIVNIASGDTLFFSGTTSGHSLEIDDVIQIVYQA